MLLDIHFDIAKGASHPALVVPRLFRKPLRLRGDEAVSFLAALLPKFNGAECATASLGEAVSRVDAAERESRNQHKSVLIPEGVTDRLKAEQERRQKSAGESA